MQFIIIVIIIIIIIIIIKLANKCNIIDNNIFDEKLNYEDNNNPTIIMSQ